MSRIDPPVAPDAPNEPGSAASDAAPEVERKRSTILFADLVGFTSISERAGPERAYEIMTRCLTLLDGVARRHGGAVDKFLGDAMMAIFGHPIAVEDPDRHALRAAHEMRQMTRNLREQLGEVGDPLDVQIGVNTGPVVFGDVGDVRREFSILGDPVNTAARLKSKAGPGGIYVGPETREGAGEGFAFRDLEPLVLKGKARPVPASELLDTLDDPTVVAGDAVDITSFVGREDAVARLNAAARSVADGRGGFHAIVGEAGIGKSRLVVESARACADLSLAWRVARARPGSDPLEPFAPLIRHFAGLVDGEPGSRIRERLRAALGAEAPTVEHDRSLACLLRVLGLRTRGGEGRPLEGLSPEAFRSVLAEAVGSVIKALAARGPLILVLEDWQWADAASQQLVRQLSGVAARSALGVWVVGRDLGELVAAAVPTTQLDRLSEEETRRLCRNLVASQSIDGEVDDEVVDLVAERGAGNPMETTLTAFLAPALQADARRAEADTHRGRETERRRATVLFADLSGFTSLSERAPASEVYEAVTSCLDRLHRIALKHGGSVDKHMGDCVMAVFGFPDAMEDAPRAAVNAAIEMRRDVERFNAERDLPSPLEVHTGIETGLTIAGSLAGSVIGEFALMGDSAKAADRITDLAESGQIFVGEETHRATREVFDFSPAGSYQLSGQEANHPSYELHSQQEQLHRQRTEQRNLFASTLVGRDDELATLESAFRNLAEGRGGIIHVLGEAGLGKSRLLTESLERVDADAIRWIEGRSLSIGRNLPFHPFADALRDLAGIEPEDDEATAAARVRGTLDELMGNRAAQATPYVLTIMALPLNASERDLVERLEGDAMENLVRRALTRLFRRLAEARPLVLVLDDLHWADLSSVELLDSLLRLTENHPILFVNLSREGFAETTGRIIESACAHHADRHHEILLQPLGTEACRLLIRNLFRGADVPHGLRTTLEERAAGNPFFVEEVIRSLLDQGALELDGGALRATATIDDAEVPGTIQEVVMSRVDQLTPERRQLLQVASALGLSFEAAILGEAVGAGGLTARLTDLVDSGLLLATEQRYEFKHPLIQEVAYDSIVEARRIELHRELGEAIEHTLPDESPGYHARLAYHYGRGRDVERAEEHLFRAGEEAARASASNEALHFFQEASALYFELHGDGGDPEKKSRLSAQVARAQSNRGQLLEAVTHYDQALEHLGERTPGPVGLALRLPPMAISLVARLYWPRTRPPQASETDRQVIALMYDRAQAETTTSPTRFIYDTMQNFRKLQNVDPAGVDKAGGMIASAVGTFAFGGVSFALAHKVIERAVPFVDDSDRREVLLFGMMRFLLDFLEGNWDDSHCVAGELLEEGVDLGALWEVANVLDLDTERRIYRGDFARAGEQLEEIGRIVDLFQYDLARASHGALRTYLHLERGEFEEALASADRYRDEHAEDSFQVLALGARAKAEVGLGRLDAAAESLLRAERVIEHSGNLLPFHRSSYLRSRALLDVARLEAEGGSARAARRSIRKALGVAKLVASRRPEVLKLAGLEAWLGGRHRRALGWWQQSLDAAETLGARPEWNRTAVEIGRRLAESGGPDRMADADATVWQARAAEGFEALGISAHPSEAPQRPDPHA